MSNRTKISPAVMVLGVAALRQGIVGGRKRVWLTAGLTLVAVAVSGCGRKYEHKRLEQDSAEAAEVREMVRVLRQAGKEGLPGVMSEQAAEGLNESQTRALRAALTELIEVDSVVLVRVDGFGPNIYRATFTLSSAGASRTAALLLVSRGGHLCWAGRN